jgi:hypothetical protein
VRSSPKLGKPSASPGEKPSAPLGDEIEEGKKKKQEDRKERGNYGYSDPDQ